MLYLGWAEYPDNSLEVISGTTSRGELLGRYYATNMTIGQWLSSGPGLYIRLRGAISREDRLNFIFTAVDNVTEGELCKIFNLKKKFFLLYQTLTWNYLWRSVRERVDLLYNTLSYVKFYSFVDGCPRKGDYLCKNLWCIEKSLRCDNVDHCGDNSDESPDSSCQFDRMYIFLDICMLKLPKF